MFWVRLGSLFMFLAVALGAFGAHALRHRLSSDLLQVFESGVRYHFYHALALFVVAWISKSYPSGLVTAAGWAFTVGVILFSGSLYVLSVTGARWLGAVTPAGGLAFLAGWILLALASFRVS
ncbi:MAG: DUF423 domain-containing protein [Acidobacteriota bacterium]